MKEKQSAGETIDDDGAWIDADFWLAYLKGLGFAKRFDAGHALNFDEAARLADMGGYEFEHHSDGRTLIKVGAMLAGIMRR